MLTIHQTQQILRLHQEGLAISAIAREVGVSRDSVRKYIADPGPILRSSLSSIVVPNLTPFLRISSKHCLKRAAATVLSVPDF